MPQVQGLALNLGGDVVFRSFRFDFNDLAGTSGSGAKTFNLLANTPNVLTIPAGSVILYIRIKHSVAFAGGSINAMTVSIGKVGGTATTFTATFDVFQAVADTTLQEGFAKSTGQLSAAQPTVVFTPTGDNCSAATAGVVNIDVAYLNVTTLPANVL